MPKSEKSESRTIFVCQQCGKESLQWLGRCPNCQAWNSFIEHVPAPAATSLKRRVASNPARQLAEIAAESGERIAIGMAEFNRVLGGGIVAGSLVLISGDPGIGKSTLLLQVAATVSQSGSRVVYVSGEETPSQIKLRAGRLGIDGRQLFLLAETDLAAILSELENLSPALAIIDSIQSVYLPEQEAAAGSVTQVRDCTMQLMRWAKQSGVPVLLVGHVTKDGAIAGPRVLEHIVDTVLYFEGEPGSAYRLLRGIKNRFGSTNEIGVFEMKTEGLVEVPNPSQVFLAQRGTEAIGSVVVPTLEGSRPVLVEIQALTNPTSFGLPRRTANGVDFNRLLLVAAVLSRRLGLKLGNQDIMVNVTGGLKIDEPAADLGIALAIASSARDTVIDPGLVAIGEIGLSGELRSVPQLDRRIAEAARLGFKRCLVPRPALPAGLPRGIAVIPAGTLREAVRSGLLPGAA